MYLLSSLIIFLIITVNPISTSLSSFGILTFSLSGTHSFATSFYLSCYLYFYVCDRLATFLGFSYPPCCGSFFMFFIVEDLFWFLHLFHQRLFCRLLWFCVVVRESELRVFLLPHLGHSLALSYQHTIRFIDYQYYCIWFSETILWIDDQIIRQNKLFFPFMCNLLFLNNFCSYTN